MNTHYETFICSGQEPGVAEGQPVIFRYPEVVVENTATMFLYDRYVRAGNRPSPNTWRSAADALTSWLNFCSEAGISLESADEEDLKDYRDGYLNTISPRGELYSPKTVALRIGYIQEYSDYLAKSGRYHGDITAGTPDKPLNRLANKIPRSPAKPTTKPKIPPSETIRPASPTDIRILMDWADQSRAPQRNRLILEVAWVCGLRKDEALGLTCPQFRSIKPDPEALNHRYHITVCGKGRKKREVAFPGWLIEEINTYIEGERNKAVAKGKPRNNPTNLFVGMRSSKTSGKPITPSAIDDLMRKACRESGLVETFTKKNPDTGDSQPVSSPKFSYHDLRHSYACLTYHLEKMEGNPEPWKKIQINLGHAHLKTTVDIYLNWVELFAPYIQTGPDYRSIL